MATSQSVSRSSSVNSSRTIVGLMFFATTFALIGNEIKIVEGKTTGSPAGLVSDGGRIILGGVFATALLTLLSHAGEGGRQFAVGLALVATATSTLVWGGPVWGAAGKIFGGTTPTTGTTATAPTSATAPTHGTATTVALAQAA